MKWIIIVLVCLLIMTLLLWVSGPRWVILEAPSDIPEIPDDVDGYLKQRESDTSMPIKEGVEASVIWAYPDKRKTEYSIIYLHGFSSSRMELNPVIENLARSMEANVFFTRLTGHGSESGELLKKVNITDWMEDALEARAIGEKIGNQVIITGTSHGGLLASWVATVPEFNNDPAALILVSPNFAPFDKRTKLLDKPWAKQVLPLLFGSHRDWDPQNSGHEHYWNTIYPVHALFPMMAQVNYITPRAPERITQPTLILYSREDTTIDPTVLEQSFHRIASHSKKLIEVENVGDGLKHILAGDILSPETNDTVLSAMQTFLRENGI